MATQRETRKTTSTQATKRVITGKIVRGYTVVGCLAAGTVGILRALDASAGGSALCLLVSVVAFGAVSLIYSK